MRRPIAILYEHFEWFRPLFAELERREVPFHRLHAAELENLSAGLLSRGI